MSNGQPRRSAAANTVPTDSAVPALASASQRSHRVSAFKSGLFTLSADTPMPDAAALRRASRQADQPDIVPPAGGQSQRLARQACVRFSDDFAVLEVQCPCFCKQLANTCEPASGLGGTIGDIRRLHDEAPCRW
ncbi:hypothetical protein [Burkholderia sp. Bp9031]|uniref:hypothetical protein n=1 Tax=Burkholderia sp. Bp9031 TaxID=2184566 RepID=UPI00163AC571|nr:hypothetical protein [Burkholderia sp. Bp9031]